MHIDTGVLGLSSGGLLEHRPGPDRHAAVDGAGVGGARTDRDARVVLHDRPARARRWPASAGACGDAGGLHRTLAAAGARVRLGVGALPWPDPSPGGRDAWRGARDGRDDGRRDLGDRRPGGHDRRTRRMGQPGRAWGRWPSPPTARRRIRAGARGQSGDVVRRRDRSAVVLPGVRRRRLVSRTVAAGPAPARGRPEDRRGGDRADRLSGRRSWRWCACVPAGSAQATALEHSAELLRDARSNGAIFLALPANGPARNSINEPGSLLRTLCQSSESTNCRGPTAAQAEFRTNGGTWPRLVGLLLIAGGLLGMLLLLGFVAVRLLAAAIFSLLYLLLAPGDGAGPGVRRRRAGAVSPVGGAAAGCGRVQAGVLVPAGRRARGARGPVAICRRSAGGRSGC